MKRAIILSLLLCTSIFATVPQGESTREYFVCDNVITNFTFTMPSNSSDDIFVYRHTIATGAELLLTISTQYTIAPTSSDYLNGGVVTTIATYDSTFQIVIVRKIKQSQERTSAVISVNTVVLGLDKVTRQVQDLWDRWERTVRLPESFSDSFDMELPFIEEGYLRINSSDEIEIDTGVLGLAWSDPVDSDIIPNLDNVYDIGSAALSFKDIYWDGIGYGDVTGDLTGNADTATTASGVVPDSVALTTDTTGNYVASITDGLAIDGGDGGSEGAAITLAFDPTELLGSRTWGDGSTDTIVWTWDRATGTDPTLTFGNALITAGQGFTVTGGLTASTYMDITPTASQAHSEGRMYYDSDVDTFVMYNAEADIALNVGEENWVFVRNGTGSTITDGQVVYFSGATGGRPNIILAKADAAATSLVAGLATHDIENNSDGYVTVFGVVRGAVTTTGLSGGDPLYLSAATAGALTTTPPTPPNFIVMVAKVMTVSGNGDVFVCADHIDYSDGVVFNSFNTVGDITSGDNFIASLGAEGTPSYTFTGDTDTGMWSPTGDTLAWSLGGSEAMRLDGTGLGIGVSPGVKLDVYGTSAIMRVRRQNNNFPPGVIFHREAAGSGDISVGYSLGNLKYVGNTAASSAREFASLDFIATNVGDGTEAGYFSFLNKDMGNILTVLTSSFVGFGGEATPETLTEWTSAVPYLTLHNSTEENADGGRESRLIFKGEQDGTEETTLAMMEVAHDGAADDEKGYIEFFVNDGADGDTPTSALKIDSTLSAAFAGGGSFADVVSGVTPVASADFATKEYVDTAIGFQFDYFFGDTASDIGGIYYAMTDQDLGGGESTLSTAGLTQADDQPLVNFATLSGEPGVQALSAGVYDVHFHAERTGGSRATVLYAALYKYETDTTETLLGTTEVSGLVTSKEEFDLHMSIASEITIDATDRLIIKFFANCDTGANTTIALYQEGDTVSHFTFSTTSNILNSLYLRVDGATTLAGAWDMGSQILTNVNIDSGVITGITDLAIADGGTGQSTAQAAIDALTAVSGATNEYVLTKDTGTGNAKWKVTGSANIAGDLPTINDSDANAMLKDHAYLTQTSGFVTAWSDASANTLSGYVHNTDDPAGAGVLVIKNKVDNLRPGISMFVGDGLYFEIALTTGTPIIIWTPLVNGGAAPIDQEAP